MNISEMENANLDDTDAEEQIDEESWNDIPDPLGGTPGKEQSDETNDGELDIF